MIKSVYIWVLLSIVLIDPIRTLAESSHSFSTKLDSISLIVLSSIDTRMNEEFTFIANLLFCVNFTLFTTSPKYCGLVRVTTTGLALALV